jgi:hypothetical protein
VTLAPLLVLALLGATEDTAPAGVGAPAAPPAREDAAPAEASAAPEEAGAAPELPRESRRRARLDGRRQELGLGWHGMTFRSEAGSRYVFHSLAIGYLGSYGSRGVFLHALGLLPIQARQDGHVYRTGNYYRRRSGGDLLVGWQWRWTFRRAEAEAGPGLHATLLWLPGKPGYRDFSAFPVGVGGSAVVRWRAGARAFSRRVILGAFGSAALDLYDPLRANDLERGLTFQAGLTAGVESTP